MRQDYTHIAIILDRSGSMSGKESDVVGGVNTLFADQRKLPGDCTVTVVQFDTGDPYEVLRDGVNLKDIIAMSVAEYTPRGGTPLYDAMGRGIVTEGERLSKMDESMRPSKVVVCIVTDGLENASREYTRDRIAAMTKEQTETYGWQFIYLGANQDAILEGDKMGVQKGTSAKYAEQKTGGALRAMSANVGNYRATGNKEDLVWSAQQRKELE